jgi:hypothetical protein
MNFIGLLFLVVTHFLSGRAVLSMFGIRRKLPVMIMLSVIIGIMIASLIPMVLELAHIRITITSITVSIASVALMLNITEVRKYDYSVFKRLKIRRSPLYELLFIVMIALLMLPSIWRAFFYPPQARDVLSGPEAIAEYTVREHTMINSVFTVNLESTNNHLKPPFVTDLQIIYKLLVFPFGQTWLTLMVLSFLVLIYTLLKEKLHPVLTGLLMLSFICIPILYGYTYVILFDYCNMVLFFLGVYFLSSYMHSKKDSEFYFSCLMFAFSTFIRLDTIVLIAMFVPFLAWFYLREKINLLKGIFHISVLLLSSYLFYFLWLDVYIAHYMPVKFNAGNEVNHNLSDFSIFTSRLYQMTFDHLLTGSGDGSVINAFGTLVHIFLAVLVTDCVFFRTFNREARVMLYALLVVYIGLPLLGYLIPWFDLNHTTKRGLFKMLPIMLIYMSNSKALEKLSAWIDRYEYPTPKAEPKMAKSAARKNKK